MLWLLLDSYMLMTYFDILTNLRIHKLNKYYSPCIAISFIGRYLLEARINAVTFAGFITCSWHILTFWLIHKLNKYYSPCIAISFIGRDLLEAQINALTFAGLLHIHDILTYSRIHKLNKYYSPCIAISFILRQISAWSLNQRCDFCWTLYMGGFQLHQVLT